MQMILLGPAMAAALHILLGFAVGAPLGLVHFATLRWNTGLYLGKGPALGLGLQVLRLAVLGTVFFLLARLGAVMLLSATLGLLAARHLLLRRTGALP
jgi:F1F0 ATPase subunit 2